MVESAPLFVEYCAEGYMNFEAVKIFGSSFALFAIALVGFAFWFGWRCGKKSLFQCNVADVLPYL